MVLIVGLGHNLVHGVEMDSLLGNGAVLVCEQHRLQVDNFFPQSLDLTVEVLVLGAEEFDLLLEVLQPLLLALATFESSDPETR